jgi:predicted transcriptional regulator
VAEGGCSIGIRLIPRRTIMTTMAFTLRTDAELEAALAELAETRGVSKQELIRQLVLDEAARVGKRRDLDAVLDRELPRWAAVLDRLGQ